MRVRGLNSYLNLLVVVTTVNYCLFGLLHLWMKLLLILNYRQEENLPFVCIPGKIIHNFVVVVPRNKTFAPFVPHVIL